MFFLKGYKFMIMPLYFYSCYVGGSDLDFIEQRMFAIPEEHQQKIADRYEKIFRSGKGWKGKNRKKANTFLHKIAKYHRNKQRELNEKNLKELKKAI